MSNFHVLYSTTDNILLHGPGGTGKTYDIKQYIAYLEEQDDNPQFAYLAPTGTAASNINGMTIHSYFRLQRLVEGKSREEDVQRAIDCSTYKAHGLELLIIDEISMVGESLLEIMDGILRNRYNVTLPMGGVRCIFSGDFYQLPPVNDEYCYKSAIWDSLNFRVLKYTEQKRYTCQATFDLLMRLRKNELIDDDKRWLKERMLAYRAREYEALEVKPIELYTANKDVDKLNAEKLKLLPGKLYTFEAIDKFTPTSTRAYLHPNAKEKILNDLIDKRCCIKIGASAILYRNYDIPSGLTNGRLCKIIAIDEKRKIVRIQLYNGLMHDITPKEYEIQGKGWKLSRMQFPIKAAWSLTTHKSQGMTLDSAIVNLSDAFAEGQIYTTIARVVSIDNIYIMGLNFARIKTSDYCE